MMSVQTTSQPGAVNSGRAAQQSARTACVNGGAPSNVVQLPSRELDSWEILRDFMDQQGWTPTQFATAMLRAATPQERKYLPPNSSQLSGSIRRWITGHHIPDAHMGDPNADGIARRILARMMGTTPDQVWPASKEMNGSAKKTTREEMTHRRQKAARQLTDQRDQARILRETIKRLQDVESDISRLEAEVKYLDAILSVPFPDDLPVYNSWSR